MAVSVVTTEPDEFPSDEDLVKAYSRTGDRAAVETLIRRYSPRLRRMVMTLVGTDEAAILDAEQEVFVAVVRALPGFKGGSRFSTFFYRVARNRVLDLIRSAGRYRKRVVGLADPESHGSANESPEQRLIDTERIATVRRAMAALSPQDRMLLYLKDGEDTGVAELSRLTGLPEGTVKSRLARSRVKVARALEELGYEH